MHPTPRVVRLALALSLAAAPLRADVFTVDDDGPADFAQLGAAVASPLVQDGDVLLVEPGTYLPFALQGKALAILGLGAAPEDVRIQFQLGTPMRLEDLPAGQELAVSRLLFDTGLTVSDCLGTVVLSDVGLGSELSISGCDDVRIEGSRGSGGVRVTQSRLELTGSILSGRPAIEVGPGSFARIAACTLTGRDGEDFDPFDGGSMQGEDGWAGIEVRGEAVVSGDRTQHTVRGGDGGVGPDFPDDGDGAPAIRVHPGGALRFSGIQLTAGEDPTGVVAPIVQVDAGGAASLAAPRDPSLVRDGDAVRGGAFALDVLGPAGSLVVLAVAAAPGLAVVPDVIGVLGLIAPLGLGSGVIGPMDAKTFTLAVPADLDPATVAHFQAVVLHPADLTLRLTNALPVVVR